jgi:peptidylprolyl isomerase
LRVAAEVSGFTIYWGFSAKGELAMALTELLIEDLIPGNGNTIKKGGALIKAHYRGYLADGTEFDSSYRHGAPFETVLSKNRVIQGWVQGLVGMQVGGTRKLQVPAALAYGERQIGNMIPPNSDLIFIIELLEALNRDD